jgi:hypothetical protein
MLTRAAHTAVNASLHPVSLVALDSLELNIGLSSILVGLDNIESGHTEMGAQGVRAGVEYLRSRIRETRS